MMNFFGKLPGFAKAPPGLERVVLRRLPKTFFIGTLFLALPPLLARFFPWDGSASEIASRIAAISLLVALATALLTVAVAAFIVLVMKGPAYVADAYPLEDAEKPD